MFNPGSFLRRLRRDQRGMTTVEYVIALCLVGAVSVGLWQSFGDKIRTHLGKATELIDEEAGTAVKTGKKTKL